MGECSGKRGGGLFLGAPSHTSCSLLSYYYSGNDRENIAEMFAVCDQGMRVFMGVITSLQGCFHLERGCDSGILRIVF